MHRFSDTIGAIAMALAKAQTELANPEKSLTGTIHPSAAGERERSFRYAPLSSGLEIVRKSLGRHEIATVQTTAIDHDAGLIRLTTLLAHSSGEWLSSDWPVCQISDVASPHRLGAALTYARRYALFTLVGIAGEDDLDAPDLSISPSKEALADRAALPGSHMLSHVGSLLTRPQVRRPEGPAAPPYQPSPDESVAMRRQLEAELSGLAGEEDVLAWARRILPTKNLLQLEDARALEQAFEQKLAVLAPAEDPPGESGGGGLPAEAGHSSVDPAAEQEAVLAIPKTRRLRDKKHLAYVSTRPCLVCGRTPSDAHHLRFSQPRALGRKVSDEFTVPICRTHHRELHDHGNEAAWWARVRIDPVPVAQQLWAETR